MSVQSTDPNWISVPQLPMLDDSSRNKINRALAKSTRVWKEARSESAELIVPVLFTNQKQILKKTERNKKFDCGDEFFHSVRRFGRMDGRRLIERPEWNKHVRQAVCGHCETFTKN